MKDKRKNVFLRLSKQSHELINFRGFWDVWRKMSDAWFLQCDCFSR